MDLLRFITAGSVDDGKSTLIGRLLFDSKSVLIDQLEAIEKQSRHKNNGAVDLALLTDGLRAEREQGITIDVAYKYFSTPKRKFIIADAPGHIQYTRNMVTGASNSDLVIILIDARKGVVEQTRRHSIIASLLKIPNIVVAINKMDLVGYSQDVFNNILIEYAKVAATLNLPPVSYFPISALQGDNIVNSSEKMRWFDGGPLLKFLEDIPLLNNVDLEKTRFPVQYVIRPQQEDLHDYRGYAGKLLSGILRTGDSVKILPSGIQTKISAVEIGMQKANFAFAPQSAIIHLEDNIDISRGDMIVPDDEEITISQDLEMIICWMDTKPLRTGNKYLFQLNNSRVRAVVKDIEYTLDVNSLEKEQSPAAVNLNDVVKIRLRTATPVVYDSYESLRANGGGILIDDTSNLTVAACMIQ